MKKTKFNTTIHNYSFNKWLKFRWMNPFIQDMTMFSFSKTGLYFNTLWIFVLNSLTFPYIPITQLC